MREQQKSIAVYTCNSEEEISKALELGVDVLSTSPYKWYGPHAGVMCIEPSLLNSLPVAKVRPADDVGPRRFETGTPNLENIAATEAAARFLLEEGMANIAAHEHELLAYGTEALLTIPGLKLIGTAREKAGILSFVLDGCRSEDVGKALDREGIAVRAGHHCAQPILRRFGLEATVRPSLAFYNTCEEIDALVAALKRLRAAR